MRSMSISTEIFLLALVLILVAYSLGAATDAGALTNLISSTVNTLTGRNPSGGPFQPYPSNAPALPVAA